VTELPEHHLANRSPADGAVWLRARAANGQCERAFAAAAVDDTGQIHRNPHTDDERGIQNNVSVVTVLAWRRARIPLAGRNLPCSSSRSHRKISGPYSRSGRWTSPPTLARKLRRRSTACICSWNESLPRKAAPALFRPISRFGQYGHGGILTRTIDVTAKPAGLPIWWVNLPYYKHVNMLASFVDFKTIDFASAAAERTIGYRDASHPDRALTAC